MKVIDLLNKIANGEDVPKKIRYQADSHKKDLYTYNEYTGDYEREIGLNLFVYLFMKERITGFLNNEVEVEIIEEDKKIEKLEHWVDVESWVKGNDLEKGLEEQSEFNKNIYYKINKIIDKLKELDK